MKEKKKRKENTGHGKWTLKFLHEFTNFISVLGQDVIYSRRQSKSDTYVMADMQSF